MLLFDLTPERGASEGHTFHPENGNIRIERKFINAITRLDNMRDVPRIRHTSPRRFFARHDRLKRDGHHADTVYVEWRKLLPWSLPFRSPTTFSRQNQHPHRQCRSPHRGRFALASYTSYTPFFESILLWFIRKHVAREIYLGVHMSQPDELGL